jgi:hypothetical protein
MERFGAGGKDNALDYPISARLSYLYDSNCINSTTFRTDVSLLQRIKTCASLISILGKLYVRTLAK